MKTEAPISDRLGNIEEMLSSNGAAQLRFSRPCEELFELKRKALDLIVEKARLNFALSTSA